MAETNPPLLDIECLIERPVIAIDGTRYEILSPDEISVLQYHRLGKGGRRIDALLAKEELDPSDTAELSRLLNAVSGDIMVGVPSELREKLGDAARLDVISVFFGLSLRKRAGSAAAAALKEAFRGIPKEAKEASTGEKPSPGSSASTAATPQDGSETSRSQSSEPT